MNQRPAFKLPTTATLHLQDVGLAIPMRLAGHNREVALLASHGVDLSLGRITRLSLDDLIAKFWRIMEGMVTRVVNHHGQRTTANFLASFLLYLDEWIQGDKTDLHDVAKTLAAYLCCISPSYASLAKQLFKITRKSSQRQETQASRKRSRNPECLPESKRSALGTQENPIVVA